MNTDPVFTSFISVAPVAKGRPRATKAGVIYTPKKTRVFEDLVAWKTRERWGKPPLKGPVTLSIAFWVKRPKVLKRAHPATRPDLDNYVKAVLDGLGKGGLWIDDGQVCRLDASKRYGQPDEDPGILIQAWEME